MKIADIRTQVAIALAWRAHYIDRLFNGPIDEQEKAGRILDDAMEQFDDDDYDQYNLIASFLGNLTDLIWCMVRVPK